MGGWDTSNVPLPGFQVIWVTWMGYVFLRSGPSMYHGLFHEIHRFFDMSWVFLSQENKKLYGIYIDSQALIVILMGDLLRSDRLSYRYPLVI